MARLPRQAAFVPTRGLLHHPQRVVARGTFGRLLERCLLCVHWAAVPLCLLLIPLFPGAPKTLVLWLTLGLVAGNAVLTWLLATDSESHLGLVRGLSTAFEWLLGLAIVFLLCRDEASAVIASGILATLVLIAAARYRLPGLLGAELVAGVSGVGMYALQTGLTDDSLVSAGLPLIRWEVILLPLGLVAGALLHANDEAYRLGEAERTQAELALRQLRTHLSPREVELLPLLAAGMTNEEIARHLTVTSATVKVHVRNLAEKLGVPGRRSAIVAAAQTLQFLEHGDSEGDCRA